MKIEMNVVFDVRFNESGKNLIVGQYDGKVFKIDSFRINSFQVEHILLQFSLSKSESLILVNF